MSANKKKSKQKSKRMIDEMKIGRAKIEKAESGAREKIIEVSTVLFAKKGLEGTSTREIAKKARLNISLISYYFGGKEGLYKAVFREHMLKFQRSLQFDHQIMSSPKVSQEDFCQEIEKVINMMVDKFSEEESFKFVALFDREKLNQFKMISDVQEEVLGPMAQQIVGFIRKAQQLKIVRPEVDAETFVVLMVESIKGYVFSGSCQASLFKNILDPKGQSLELKKMISQVFVRGILK